MISVIQSHQGPTPIYDKPHWHLVDPQSLFYHNARFGKGHVVSVSQIGVAGAVSPYSLLNRQPEKEEFFESIRKAQVGDLPPRLGALFVFDDYALVEKAQEDWYKGEERPVYECRLWVASSSLKADARWLDARREDWPDAARKYWAGEMSDDPFPEIVIKGALFFPDWENFPLPY